jgi:CRP-like cAMP-binding protein
MPVRFFKRLAVFEGIAEEWLVQLASSAEERSFGPNSIVFRKDDPCDGLYVISRGGVVVRNEVVGQPIERVRELGPGDLFGESEAFDGTPRRFSARTLGATTVYRIPEEPLLSFLQDHPEIEIQLRAPVVRRRAARQHALLAPASRMEPRIWIDREVVVTLDDGHRLELKLENLSTGGACLSAAPDEWRVTKILSFALGTPIRPELLKVSGAVRWRLGDAVGISFDGAGPALRRRIERAVRELVPEAETL